MFKADAEAATQAEQAEAEAEAAALEAAQAAAAPAQQVLEQDQEEVQAFEAQMVCVLNFQWKFLVFRCNPQVTLCFQTEPAGYESELDPEYTLAGAKKSNIAIENPNFVDPGMTTDNEYNKTHPISKEEASQNAVFNYLIIAKNLVRELAFLHPEVDPATEAGAQLRKERRLAAQQNEAQGFPSRRRSRVCQL